tara:strand:+ start:47 stop:325 length:279 start_codon:yes stop_codon:yes gene_type:complete
MASMAKWQQRAREALRAGRVEEYRSIKGKLGPDFRKSLESQYLKKEPVKVEAKPAPAPAPKPAVKRTAKKATPRKTATKRAPARKRATKNSE